MEERGGCLSGSMTTILKPHDCAVCHDFELCSDYGLAAPNQSECWITDLPIVNSKVGGSKLNEAW